MLDRSRSAVLQAATRVLLQAPATSLADLSATLGIGRTTLHRLFPTREDLLRAIAHDALDHLHQVYAAAGITRPPPQGPQARAALDRLVDRLIPLGPSLMFLLRSAELATDPELARRVDDLDRAVHATVGAAVKHGDLDADVPTWWAVEALFASVYVAWEQIEHGRLAPLDAPALVTRTWLRGVGG